MKPRRSAPLNALRAFEAAARHSSFNLAAAQLFVTPAAISHQVKHLEAYLGARLFHRGHRSIELTPHGQELAATLGELFVRLDSALDRAMSGATAELRISSIESFAAKWLAPRLHRFYSAWPGLRVHVETGNQQADFIRDCIDVAIRYGPGGYPGVHAELLLTAEAFPVCSPKLLESDSPPLRQPRDLRRHTLLHDESSLGRPGVPCWSAWLEAAGAGSVAAGSGPVFASNYLAQEAAVAGHGVALGIAPLVAQDLAQGKLIRPFAASSENAYGFWMVRHQPDHAPLAVEAFCRWLREEAETSA